LVDGEFAYPADTAIADMSEAQKTEYWRHKARQHETRNKGLAEFTPARIKELKDIEAAHKAAEHAAKSDVDKSIEAARAEGRSQALAESAPALVRAELVALTAGRQVNGQPVNVDAVLAGVNAHAFMAVGGVTVDTDKVKLFVDGFAPALKAPNFGGGGSGPTSSKGTGSVQSGADLFAQMHPTK
jgi:hypothetical protein